MDDFEFFDEHLFGILSEPLHRTCQYYEPNRDDLTEGLVDDIEFDYPCIHGGIFGCSNCRYKK